MKIIVITSAGTSQHVTDRIFSLTNAGHQVAYPATGARGIEQCLDADLILVYNRNGEKIPALFRDAAWSALKAGVPMLGCAVTYGKYSRIDSVDPDSGGWGGISPFIEFPDNIVQWVNDEWLKYQNKSHSKPATPSSAYYDDAKEAYEAEIDRCQKARSPEHIDLPKQPSVKTVKLEVVDFKLAGSRRPPLSL